MTVIIQPQGLMALLQIWQRGVGDLGEKWFVL